MNNYSVKYILTIVIFSSLLGLLYNWFSPAGINIFISKEGKNNNFLMNNESAFIIPSINPYQADLLLDDKNTIFIDARDKWDFEEGHIIGAVNLPEYKYDELIIEDIIPDKNNLYIVYCSDEDCGTSAKLAEKLAIKGYSNLLILSGGWNSWSNEGYPSE